MTEQNYMHIVDLASEAEPPDDGILSRNLFDDDRVKAVIFGFAQGEELWTYYLTSNYPART